MPLSETRLPYPPEGHRWEISEIATEMGCTRGVNVKLIRSGNVIADSYNALITTDIDEAIESVGTIMHSMLARMYERNQYQQVLHQLQDAVHRVNP